MSDHLQRFRATVSSAMTAMQSTIDYRVLAEIWASRYQDAAEQLASVRGALRGLCEAMRSGQRPVLEAALGRAEYCLDNTEDPDAG